MVFLKKSKTFVCYRKDLSENEIEWKNLFEDKDLRDVKFFPQPDINNREEEENFQFLKNFDVIMSHFMKFLYF